MNAVRNAALQAPLRTALVVSANEGHARVDRISLKNAKIHVSRAVQSGRAAREHLLKYGADVVIVDDILEDGAGWDFVQSLKSDHVLRHIPVILATSSAGRDRVMEAIRLGCAGFLVRPYSLDTFFKHLTLARQAACFLREEMGDVAQSRELAEQGRAEEALPKLEKALETPDDAQHHYELGMRLMATKEYGQAVECFTRAVQINALLAEAHLGLARCWLALGDEVRYRKALTRAADISAKGARFERYKDEFLAILKADPYGFNPFVTLGMRLARERDWDGALMALKNAIWLCPDDAKAHLELAKAYHFKRDPELAKRSVSQALTLSSHEPEAHDLYERWTGRVWGEEAQEPEEVLMDEKSMFPDMIPVMLNGVLYLAGMVTEGLHRFRRDYA
ncbi:MAG: response regulator [Desulfovibrio sp.]|nr:response regulator [Desulfovibrio sp.]